MKKQTDGRYRTRVTVGHNPDGTAIVKYASGRTQKELRAAAEELRRFYVTGAADIRRDYPFEVFAEEWYKVYKKPSLRPTSWKDLRSVLDVHLNPAFKGRQLRAIQDMDVQAFLNSKAGYSASMIDKMYKAVRELFRKATSLHLIDRNPTLDLSKPDAEAGTRRALTLDERRASVAVGKSHPEGLLLLIYYYLGLRRGEALGLQWGDIDFKARTVKIQRDIDYKADGEPGKLKTDAAHRTIPIPDTLYAALDARRGIGTAFIIQSPQTGTQLAESTYKRRWNRLMAAMVKADAELHAEDPEYKGIEQELDKEEKPTGRSILTAHYYRHNYVSILYDAGVDVLTAAKWLGHEKKETVLSIYTHLSSIKEGQNVAEVNRAFALL